MSKEARLQQLTTELQQAAKAYYTENREIMSNKEYDQKYDELVALEQELGTSLPDSPTHTVGYKVVSHLEKVTHEVPALSLDKTKDRESLISWLNGKMGVLSWKRKHYEKNLSKMRKQYIYHISSCHAGLGS